MESASTKLQKAIYGVLSEHYSVYEVTPLNAAFPYITIGEEAVTHNHTKTNKRSVHLITLHTWSKGQSSSQSKTMNDLVINKLLNELSINDYSLDEAALQLLTTLKEAATDATIFHGVIQIEFIITQ